MEYKTKFFKSINNLAKWINDNKEVHPISVTPVGNYVCLVYAVLA